MYTLKLGLKIQKSNIGLQKIDRLFLKIYNIVIADFKSKNKLEKILFLFKHFLLINTSLKIVMKIFLLILNKIKIQFAKKDLI